jgi:hypothetical protein
MSETLSPGGPLSPLSPSQPVVWSRDSVARRSTQPRSLLDSSGGGCKWSLSLCISRSYIAVHSAEEPVRRQWWGLQMVPLSMYIAVIYRGPLSRGACWTAFAVVGTANVQLGLRLSALHGCEGYDCETMKEMIMITTHPHKQTPHTGHTHTHAYTHTRTHTHTYMPACASMRGRAMPDPVPRD